MCEQNLNYTGTLLCDSVEDKWNNRFTFKKNKKTKKLRIHTPKGSVFRQTKLHPLKTRRTIYVKVLLDY